MQTQRDRGRRKKHHGSRALIKSQGEDYAGFADWLAETYPIETEGLGGPAATISLNRFLQDSGQFDLSAAAKLRELAILWEADCLAMDQPTGWHVLTRIYDEAIRLDPNWSALYHSKAVGARACSSSASDPAVLERILTEAEQACRQGLAINPHDGLLHHALGDTLYEQSGRTIAALACFEAAITHNSEQVWWSHLYRAHCLHDLGRWHEAVDAYRSVDRSRFVGATTWRGQLVSEQLAHCLYYAGEAQESRTLFQAAVSTYQVRPGSLDVTRYVRAAAAFFPDDLGPSVAALLRAEGVN